MNFVDVFLRVPPVFLMDISLNSTWFPASKVDDTAAPSPLSDGEYWDEISFSSTILLRLLGVVGAIFLFILPTDMLITAYTWLTSVGVILGSFRTNAYFTRPESEDADSSSNHTPLEDFCVYFSLQCLFAVLFILTYRQSRDSLSHRLFLVAVFVAPSLLSGARCLGVSVSGVLLIQLVTLIQVFYMLLGVLSHANTLLSIGSHVVWWTRIVVRQNGLPVFLDSEWTRLRVPYVLRVFWLARFCEHVVLHLTALWASADEEGESRRTALLLLPSAEDILETMKQLLVSGCDTIVAVLGMTSVVSSIAHHLGRAVQQFLAIQDEDDKGFGTVSAILFFVLALQTGLTGLEPDKRFVRLYRNFCLLFTAILHFVHNMVSPLLMSLSASRNRSVRHHVRALLVCTFLVVFPCWFLFYLWRTHPVSTWLLAVSAFSIEVTVKVVISLLIYTLFMLDAYRNTFWERLDDYVYYVRATGNTVEFLFGIFLFFNGTWILVFESGGTIRAIMMCIHAYFNIWVQAKTGWKVFIRRRTAVNKINTFPEATADQLHALDDVCAICYQEMTSARITWCRHYFHALCLRKWLYIQDRCPMCHKALYQMETEEEEDDDDEQAEDQPVAGEHEDVEERNGIPHPAIVVVGDDSNGQHVEVPHPHQD